MNSVKRNYYVLVTAHPDDETMFFLPTLYNLINTNNDKKRDDVTCDNQFYILCLSNGNFDGLGIQRTEELHKAVNLISSQIHVTVLDHPQLQDGPRQSWSKECITNIMIQFLKQHISAKIQDNTNSNVILFTFDIGGVSGHPNHIDTFFGLEYFHGLVSQARGDGRNISGPLRSLVQNTEFKLIVLESVYNPIAKYFCFIELFYLIIGKMFSLWFGKNKSAYSTGTKQTFIMVNPKLVWNTMKAHYTQFVWYRKLFVIFSRYSYINTTRVITTHERNLNEEKKR